MRVVRLDIKRFRGIKSGEIFFPKNCLLVGNNNVGKSTILEAIDLVLGPERMRRKPVIDEHDFFAGDYLDSDNEPLKINIEVVVTDLNEEQETSFHSHLQFWNEKEGVLLDSPPAETTNKNYALPALSFSFEGKYDKEEDDFVGNTYFQHPGDEEKTSFTVRDKRKCGFLFLRTLRTGSRALSLERGSLLDIILNLNEVKLNMWEDILKKLREIHIANSPELKIVNILDQIQEELKSLVTSDWGSKPQMKVSDLTREGLRKTLNVFLETGAKNIEKENHIAPFRKQGTGTINMLVLSMLSIIANLKQNVIFAMEEPEIAIPPHTQKRIINSIRAKSAQALFSSHSPYILEEFEPHEIIALSKKDDGEIISTPVSFPENIKRKSYKQELRKRYCEALLADRVLIVEGQTEYDAIPVVARRLHDLDPSSFSSLEALGVTTIDAGGDSQVAIIGKNLKSLGKTTLAVHDKQADERQKKLIEDSIDYPFESPEGGFEKLIVENIPPLKLKEFALNVADDGLWPKHLADILPSDTSSADNIKDSLYEYFGCSKGAGSIANLLTKCSLDEIPQFLKDVAKSITTEFCDTDYTEALDSSESNHGD